MNLAIWIANIFCALAFGYVTTWSGATLALGRAISTAGTKTGYQDAVTPPWVANLLWLTYIATAAVIIASWYTFGWVLGCISILIVLAGSVGFDHLLPSEHSHYKILIIQSMVSRYANYVRDNDSMRAGVMKELLASAGVPIEKLVSAPTASGAMSDIEATKIINAYGNAMTDRKSAYGDLSELPYAKDRIKEALIHGIKESDDPKFREQLKAAYVALADWQAGLGTRRAAAELTDADLKDPAKVVAHVLAGEGDFLKVPQEVAAEAELLLADLKALERASGVITNASVASAAKKMAAETLAVAFLRDEPSMAPELAAKLRVKFATDCPEAFFENPRTIASTNGTERPHADSECRREAGHVETAEIGDG